MLEVQRGPLAGVLGQLLVLAALAEMVGLVRAGWLAGLLSGGVVTGCLALGLARRGDQPMGPADRVTLVRATLVGGVAALTAGALSGSPHRSTLVALAAVALALDLVDGRVARRTRSASRLGARFDMEVDALLILVLSIEVARTIGAWVLVIGAARYALLVAGWFAPWLRRPSPPRYWGKVVAATQGVVLTVVAARVLPDVPATLLLLTALAMLAESFGREVWWLRRHRYAEPAPVARRAWEQAA